jgi:hypothetical protein
MRIVAYFACRYCEAVIGLLEGLLAEYRAGTLVLPEMVDESSTIAADHWIGKQRTAQPDSRGPSARRSRTPGGVPANEPSGEPAGDPACESGQSAVRDVKPAPRRPAFAVASSCPQPGRPVASPRGRFVHPSAVPRSAAEKIAAGSMRKSTPNSLRYQNNTRGSSRTRSVGARIRTLKPFRHGQRYPRHARTSTIGANMELLGLGAALSYRSRHGRTCSGHPRRAVLPAAKRRYCNASGSPVDAGGAAPRGWPEEVPLRRKWE